MLEPPSERAIIFVVGAVQFVNILDFIIVMPLGPDFAKALDIPVSHLGYIGGSYTASAAVSGLLGALFLDRFDRRKALAVAMLGLVTGTFAGALARGFGSLMAARVLAGAFGGPATSLSYSIIADVIPPERRGKAMGAVMGAFAAASVLGVPAGLELAQRGGWRLPFIAVATLGAIIATLAYARLPPMAAHLARRGAKGRLVDLVRLDVVLSLLMTADVMIAGFILIPNISAYVLNNLLYPRERLGLLYLVGGAVSFFAMRFVGFLVDRYGAFTVGTMGSLLFAAVVYFGFVTVPPPAGVMLTFVAFMVSMSFRNVPYNTLTSKVPRAEERARFTSVQSAVQHLASASGAFISARMLTERADKSLVGISRVAATSILLALALPPLMWAVESRVKRALQRRDA